MSAAKTEVWTWSVDVDGIEYLIAPCRASAARIVARIYGRSASWARRHIRFCACEGRGVKDWDESEQELF